ncbi:MAG: type II secretion system protein [Clostridia bacterium]|nr:type II secretion system protein [Clostridia bacterium]
MKKNNKKGFTIVELVVVIAVIGILAAVLIPTFSNIIEKANKSSDMQLVRNLNTALTSNVGEEKTMQEALDVADEFGYNIAKINAKASEGEILWDSVNQCFVYLDGKELKYVPDTKTVDDVDEYKLWQIASDVSDIYSTYLYKATKTEFTTSKGIDVGSEKVNSITYNGSTEQEVVIRTNGGTLTINAPNDTIHHYGNASEVIIEAVAGESFHEFGKADFTQIKKGRYVMEETGSTNALVVVDTANVVVATDNANNIAIKHENKTQEQIEEIKTGATLFAGGIGTEADPYLIADVEDLVNITTTYEKDYTYYKVANGVSEIDCAELPRGIIKLRGSFDGNGVKFVNLPHHLFRTVGYQNQNDEIVLQNFDATFNATSDAAVVRNIFNSGKTTFKNINVHGYIEGNYNMGSFYNYGTANFDDLGASYTVEFINSKSDATLVCTTGNTIGGMLGHGYEGSGNTLTINMDANSKYTGTMYTNSGHEVMAMCSVPANCMLNDEIMGSYKKYTGNVKKLEKIEPTKESNGYYIAKHDEAATIKISINAQVTSYDENGNQITNSSGITMILGTKMITKLSDSTKVLDSVNSIQIINELLDDEIGYTLKGGVLKAYVGDRDALSGSVTLYVTQYDVNGSFLTTGSIKLGEVVKA